MKLREPDAPDNPPTCTALSTEIVVRGAPFFAELQKLAECDGEEPAPEPWAQIDAECQLDLFRDSKDQRNYRFPAMRRLLPLCRDRVLRREQSGSNLSNLTDRALFERLAKVYFHRGREVSPYDRQHQRELIARSVSGRWLDGLSNIELPRLYGLSLGDGVYRQRLIRVLQILDVQGWLGLYISGADGSAAIGCSPTHWWRVVAWLEQHGWLVRIRTYKTKKFARDGSRDLYKNWYAPGPALLAWRKFYRDELAGDRHLFRSATRAQRRLLELGATEAPSTTGSVPSIAVGLGVGWVCDQRVAMIDEERAVRSARIYGTGRYEPAPEPESFVPLDGDRLEQLEQLVASPQSAAVLEQAHRALLLVTSCDRRPEVVKALYKEGSPCTAAPAGDLYYGPVRRVPARPEAEQPDPSPEGCPTAGRPSSRNSAVLGLEQAISERFGSHVIMRPPDPD